MTNDINITPPETLLPDQPRGKVLPLCNRSPVVLMIYQSPGWPSAPEATVTSAVTLDPATAIRKWTVSVTAITGSTSYNLMQIFQEKPHEVSG